MGIFTYHSQFSKMLNQTAGILAMVGMTFLGLLLVTFLIGRVVPIDPVMAVVGDKASAEVYERVRLQLGLHLPLWQQFFVYIKAVLAGDFGVSALTARPVLEDIAQVFPATMELAVIATLIGVFAGVPLGIFPAVKQGSLLDHLLPASLLGYYSMAYLSRMTRSFMIEQLRQEYILTARVKGVAEWRVIWGHALGNCRIPLITVIALSFGSLLEGSVLTETVFSWPGLDGSIRGVWEGKSICS